MPAENTEYKGAADILHAAKELFAEKGFDAVSISAISERAGSSKANIFHHYGSKQGLYFAVMREIVDQSVFNMRELMTERETVPARLEKAIRQHYAMLEADPERARLIMREVMFSSPQQGQALAEEVYGEHFSTVTQLVSSLGIGCGERAAFVAFVMMAANVMRFHSRNVMRHFPDATFAEDMDTHVARLVELLLAQPAARRLA